MFRGEFSGRQKDLSVIEPKMFNNVLEILTVGIFWFCVHDKLSLVVKVVFIKPFLKPKNQSTRLLSSGISIVPEENNLVSVSLRQTVFSYIFNFF